MRVLQSENVFLTKRITGPAHNLLALDFTQDIPPYVKDLAESESPAVSEASVCDQVDRAFTEFGIDRGELTGIQFHGGDTPSESVYYELAKVILEARRAGNELDQFTPRWTPPGFERAADESE